MNITIAQSVYLMLWWPAWIFKYYSKFFINFPIFKSFWPNNQQLSILNNNSILNNDDIDPDKNVYNLLHEDCRYYLSCELQDAIGRLDVSNKLSILYINAHSMLGKLGQICVLLKAILDCFDILAMSKTRESTFNEQLINIPGYRKISP